MGSRRSAPLRAYRIADRRHKIFDGAGAAIHGGRWNSPGRRVIYAAETYAGAMLEALAHANIGRLPKTHAWIEILIGKGVRIEEVNAADVPGWHASNQRASREYGDLVRPGPNRGAGGAVPRSKTGTQHRNQSGTSRFLEDSGDSSEASHLGPAPVRP